MCGIPNSRDLDTADSTFLMCQNVQQSFENSFSGLFLFIARSGFESYYSNFVISGVEIEEVEIFTAVAHKFRTIAANSDVNFAFLTSLFEK
ncbi:hypothetical protein L596_021396 [Steinernema carpocapsae]|uniref:Uncharacterized protein n=1 Tax=Steinernema carpocapsae TaxID=34508 RepID=A0A4U5MJ04_STECR|nr:hypothetical protein L596_021396 [Steinernema carpocapsae]